MARPLQSPSSTILGTWWRLKLDKGDSELAEITREIVTYLEKHPAAQDTLEGITQWWLLEQDINRETARVRSALATLVAQGIVGANQGPGGRIYYCANRSQIADSGNGPFTGTI